MSSEYLMSLNVRLDERKITNHSSTEVREYFEESSRDLGRLTATLPLAISIGHLILACKCFQLKLERALENQNHKRF